MPGRNRMNCGFIGYFTTRLPNKTDLQVAYKGDKVVINLAQLKYAVIRGLNKKGQFTYLSWGMPEIKVSPEGVSFVFDIKERGSPFAIDLMTETELFTSVWPSVLDIGAVESGDQLNILVDGDVKLKLHL